MKAGRGYIIRFFDERNNTALFYKGESGYSRTGWVDNLEYAKVFLDHEDAVNNLVSIKKETKKSYKKGYLYISKVFYQEKKQRGTWNGKNGEILVPTKLTKPDRHDFLQAI